MREMPGREYFQAILDRAAGFACEPATAVGDLPGVIEHTLLRPDATRADVERLCEEALQHRFVAVCVNPLHVSTAAMRLAGGPVRVVSVAGFPLGASHPEVKLAEIQQGIEDGAAEVDMVIDLGSLKSGDYMTVGREIEAAAEACHRKSALLKVILETSLLSNSEKAIAAWIGREAGADFVKTSTGFGSRGATPEDVAILRETVGPALGVKASGGIRTLATARMLLAAGANRLGTSRGIPLLEEAEAERAQSTMAATENPAGKGAFSR